MQKILARRAIDVEAAVRDPSAGRQNETRSGQTPGSRTLDARSVERNRNTSRRIVVSEHDFHPLGPDQGALRRRILLFEGESRNSAVLDFQMRRDVWPSSF